MDIIIVDSIHIYMVQRALTTTHATMMGIKEKTQSYIEQAPSNDFIPIAIEAYGGLHFCFNSFLTTCAYTTMAHHQQSSLFP
jgi:hypothetical protein